MRTNRNFVGQLSSAGERPWLIHNTLLVSIANPNQQSDVAPKTLEKSWCFFTAPSKLAATSRR
jgi:hypothetical protein